MRAIIPVAGVGSRLRPHTYAVPKVLLNVAGKPIIGHILDKIIADGFNCATIIVGYLGEMVKEYVTEHYELKVDFIEQEERKGLAHAISLARGTFSDEPLLIILGDTIFEVDLKPVIGGGQTAVGVKFVDDPRRFGIVEMADNTVTRFIEKPEHPTSNLAIVGLYWIMRPQKLVECIDELFKKDVRTKGEYQLTDALELLRTKGESITSFPVEGWFDCGKPETLLSTNRHLLERLATKDPVPGVVIVPPVYISRDSRVTNSIIGPFTTIAAGAQVNDSVIRNSIVSENAVVNKVLLENSLVGNDAIVNGTFKRANVGNSAELDFF
ncbi:MAG TPA: sugar phosphate nucleotidyltransferase [Bacteroidota bacterium]|nr:sugar phosphate nucleotidyltransferase [Bacteroidota bacterium]